jgi:cell division protein FtsQ
VASQASTKTRARTLRIALRYGLIIAAVTATLTAGIYTSQKFQQFMLRDPRFFLPGPADYGFESPNLQVDGVKYASRAHILRLFDHDYGRSLYLFPLAERRKALLNIRWVHDASIERIWPNRIIVRVSERRPVAFIKLPGDGMARWALIDDEGVILDPPPKAPFDLPVLAGVQPRDSQDLRGKRVRRILRLMKDLGGLAKNVSEADAADLDNLKITEQLEGSAVVLMLGDRNFATRLQNFLDHFANIHRKMPDASQFDLRLDDRITALETRDGR